MNTDNVTFVLTHKPTAKHTSYAAMSHRIDKKDLNTWFVTWRLAGMFGANMEKWRVNVVVFKRNQHVGERLVIDYVML